MTLEERVAALEERLNQEAGLRASGDQDLSDLTSAVRAMRHLVQAVSITQTEQTQKLERVEAAVARVEGGVSDILRMLERLTSGGDE